MNGSSFWEEVESGEGLLQRFLRYTVLAAGVGFLLFAGIIDLTWPQQALLGLVTVLLAIWMDRSSSSYLITLTLMLTSCYSTFRYGYWRISYTVRFFLDPGTQWTALDGFFIWLLVFAETYAFIILFLGYMQTLWPLRRTPVPLPDDPEEWPAIDLLIPTYNEPLSVVRFTALASMNIDWPADKLNVYLLDDGNREEFRRFAQEAGIGYMTREDHAHAKAGNINHAIARLTSPLVCIFDCDHVPTRSFLQMTVGWFLRDAKLGMLQTPHHFYSPDPFERNLGQFRTIPNEGELFYGIVQDGNDFWNATFFCGSCAVLRRSALDEIGGIAVETVTEDAHTSMRMQRNGWNTAYINIPQAAGLATETLSSHVKQRIRWARGMIQIMRLDNPLFAKGLKPAQRLCYFNAMSHFLYALPRLIFLSAPLIYLILGHTNVAGYWAAILAYAFPHLVLSNITNSRIQGHHRHSFWNEIYETVLAPYIFLPTMLALINPRFGSFEVTAKGGVVNRGYFDTHIAQPFLLMLGLNLFGLLMGIPRFFYINLPVLRTLFDGAHPGTIVMNVLWTLFNMVILGVATAVAWESQQRRQTVRVAMAVPTDVVLANGVILPGVTADLSSGGVMIQMEPGVFAEAGDVITLVFPVLDGDASLPATIVGLEGGLLRAQFDPLTLHEEEALTMVLYSRADMWLGWGESREADKPLRSLTRILQLSVYGMTQTLRGMMGGKKKGSKSRLVAGAAPLILLTVGMAFHPQAGSAQAAPPGRLRAAQGARAGAVQEAPLPGQFVSSFSLGDAGPGSSILLRGVDPTRTVAFHVAPTQVVRAATMRLRYQFSPGLIAPLSHLRISLNGTLVATVPAPAADATNSNGQRGVPLEETITLPPGLIAKANELRFDFVGHYTQQCEDVAHTSLWAEVDGGSVIELTGSLLPLANDLKLLPSPFYDAAADPHPVVPIVFLLPPSAKALRAAAIVASWFGTLSDYHGVRFPVSIGRIPTGNAIVIGENPVDLPGSLNVSGTAGPALAMRTNPMNPYTKVLVITGDNGEELVQAAYGLTMQRDLLQGEQVTLRNLKLPAHRLADDAPRWLSTKRVMRLGEMGQNGDLQGDGGKPLGVYMRLPPDLYTEHLENLRFHLGYRYNSIPLGNDSSMQIAMNGSYIGSVPLPHSDRASANLEAMVPIPVASLRPFSNSMLMTFLFQPGKKVECGDAPANLQGAIMKDSYLDLQGVPHWAALPDLQLFANAGFPFTRLADLSETTIVLPDVPSVEEIEILLTMMGHFGAQTGYPVLQVDVANAEGMKADRKRDYLVIGTVDDQPALKMLGRQLPIAIDGSGLHLQDTQGFFAPLQHAWWRVRSSDPQRSGELETVGGLPDALLEGIEWPRGSSRSVVVLALRDKGVAATFLSAFLQASQTSDIAQSVSVLRGSQFASYRIGEDSYRVGTLSPWMRANLVFSRFPWLVVLSTLLVCLLMSSLLRAMLRRRARNRLQGSI